MNMIQRVYIDTEPEYQGSETNSLEQGLWFDNGLYREWLVFLSNIWNSIEYL